MKSRYQLLLLGVLLFCAGRSILAADPPPDSMRNPFAAPARFTRYREVQLQPTETTELQLRATMITKEWSMANVNGTMLMPGDAINGYRLLQVLEDKAIFMKNGDRVIVTIDDEK